MSQAGAGGRSGRRRLRLLVGVSVALTVLLGSDQGGLLAAVTASPATVASASLPTPSMSTSTSLAGGFEALAPRLRLDDAAVAAAAAEPAPTDLAATGSVELAPGAGPAGGDIAIAPPPPAFDGELSAPPPPPPAQLPPSRYDASTAGGGTWALVIGINDYPGIRYDLRSAVNDANDVNEALGRLGVTSDRRLVLRDQQADADTIRAGLDWLSAHAGPGSTRVFFFAGHVQRIERGREALVGTDGGIVLDTEVAALLDRSPSERAWITIAGCYGGGFDEVLRPGRILTAAAPADQVACENEGFGRSYLVEYMVRRAMLARGISTVEGAFAWAMAELQRDYPERLPVQLDAVGGDLDLRVGPAPTSSSSSPPPGSPPPSSPPPSSPPPPSDDCSSLTAGVVRCS